MRRAFATSVRYNQSAIKERIDSGPNLAHFIQKHRETNDWNQSITREENQRKIEILLEAIQTMVSEMKVCIQCDTITLNVVLLVVMQMNIGKRKEIS